MLNIFNNYTGGEAIIVLIAFFIAVIVSLSVHEYAHAYVAYRQGDYTAKAYGRLTLNPKAHIDPFGMLMLFLVGFGWAKPVPINPVKFKKYRLGFFLVSIAGVTVNFILFLLFAFLTALITKGIIPINVNTSLGLFAVYLVSTLQTVNFSLAVFNLIPIAPLDGYNILTVFFKRDNDFLKFLRENGQWVLIILFITGILEWFVYFLFDTIAIPISNFFTTLL